MFPSMKMLATKIKLNINNVRSLYRSAQHLIKIFPVTYTNTPDFGYSNEKLKSWAKLYPSWSRQYPIVIYSGSVEVIGMAPLQIEGYDKIVPGRLAMGNNGYTISISLTQDKNPQCNSCRPPTISGGLLKNVYEFEELHFHWTKRNNRGCEHVIDNIRYPLEMHLVHRNIKYDCIEKALEHEDGLCVATVFFDISEMPYKPFNTIIDNFIYVQNTNTNITLEYGLVLDSLLPANVQNFYTYKGSLLSPPYNKSINWVIFSQPIYISFDQFSAFQLLQKNQDNEIFDNCQNIQPIEEKKIYARDPNIPFIPACDVPCPNIPITTNADVSCPHIPATNYNEMYFPVLSNNEHKSKLTNNELLDPTLTKKEVHNSTTSYNEMYFPNPLKDKSEQNEKIKPNPTSTNKEHDQSTATYNKMGFPIPPTYENEKNKNIESNSTYTNKEVFDPTCTKEEHHRSTTTYNQEYFPISSNDENASDKKIESNSTSSNEEAIDPISNEYENQSVNKMESNTMYFPISSKDENASDKKIEPNKEELEPSLNKKDETDENIDTNVLSTKNQARGLTANIKNMIREALIKFFSK